MSDELRREEPEIELNAQAEAMPEEEAEFDLADYMEQYQALQRQLEQSEQSVADEAAKLLRLQADFDNYRRRQREQYEEQLKQAAANLAEALLPVVDNFDRALAAMADSADKEGVELISRQLLQVLETAGLAEIPALGAEFDPNLHQAVLQSDAGAEQVNKVTMVLQKGYTFNGKLIRASMVQVGK